MVFASKKKVLAFYSILTSGHLNVCSALGSVILNKYSDVIDVYFIVDKEWQEKLAKKDSRYKFAVIEYDCKESEEKMANIINELEATLKMSEIEKLEFTWKLFSEDFQKTLNEVDAKSEAKLREIEADFILMDQGWHLPAAVNYKKPYGFVCSCNPLWISLSKELPVIGCSAKLNDKKAIQAFNDQFEPTRTKTRQSLLDLFVKRGVKWDREDLKIDLILSDHITIYSYPLELDYFSSEFKDQNKLLQIDSAITKDKISEPYELPQEFKELPGEIVYVSLGSLFSVYTRLIQKLIDVLDKLPYKYIVSKGANGDKISFPSLKFIGENYIDQLGVLQVVDAAIVHGGNNTFCECFYLGVPQIIMPVLFDQINNATHVEETEFGFKLDIMKYTEEELSKTLNKVLTDKAMKLRLKKVSERMQKENRIVSVADEIVDYICKL